MESKGYLKGVSKDWITGNFLLTFEVDHDVSSQLPSMAGKTLRMTVKQWREKRSLDANAYYWVLLSRLSESLGISKPRAHNIILRKYGQPETFDGSGAYIRIPDTEKAEETALEASTYHIRPTSQVVAGTDGVDYRTYIMLKGSSAYDTQEMSVLIEGLVSECKELGIETLPPDEIKRMLMTYEANRRKDG
nr:MAG TPA: NinB protein [Caudoviricetes sp.]